MKDKSWKIEKHRMTVRKEDRDQAIDEWAEIVYRFICQFEKDQTQAPLTASIYEAERDAGAA